MINYINVFATYAQERIMEIKIARINFHGRDRMANATIELRQ